MDHRLSPELEELRRTVEEFAHDVVAPKIGDFYERHEFPYEIVREMGRMGLFGLPFPEEYGGMGGDYLALAIALEELARVDSSVAITLEAGVSLGAMPIHLFGTEEQKREWLPRLCAGEILGAFGLTEPDGGSDAGATRTTARLDPDTDEWVINGSKCFITNSGTDITGLVTVTAVTGRKPDGRPEISAIIVPSGTPGFTVAAPYSKVGWNASDTRELSFQDVRVPAGNLLGEQGRGYAQFLRILDEGRIAIAALATGLAQGCVDESVKYAKERQEEGGRERERERNKRKRESNERKEEKKGEKVKGTEAKGEIKGKGKGRGSEARRRRGRGERRERRERRSGRRKRGKKEKGRK
ncbi:hypothetical protein GCM10017687_16280 [Streptomyces echinatus]